MTMAILTKINFHGKYSGCSLLFLIRQTITLFYVILLPVFINTLHGQICNAQPPHMCNGINYTKGSNFERNLNTVLNSLVERASQTDFNTSVYGQIPDEIYGLLQCSGNATAQQCYNCSKKSVSSLRQVCGSVIGGRVWLEDCYLRYENVSFFGQLDYYGKYEAIPQNVSSPDIFNAALEKLLKELAREATSGSRYASGTVEDSSSRNIYGMAQCWKDITSDDCRKCLLYTINNIVTLYNGSEGVDAFIGSCRVRYYLYSLFYSIAETPAITVAISPPSSNNTQTNRRSGRASNKMPIILSAVGGLLLVLFVCLFGFRRRLKSAIFRRPREGHEQVENEEVLSDRQIVFNMKTLITATANFHDDNKLGEGGFGPVYKGTTEDGKQIAVKKLSLKSKQGEKEFLNEVKLVANVQHRNLVNLLGCCAEGSERLLVYEYLPNKSLDRFLFDADKRKELDWQKRYNIILGVARGLLYLHQDSRLRIVHRDIKASNILLDEKLNPRIADFGLAKLFPEEETHVSTRILAGTLGYMAPEYALQGQVSVKVDVYSFGVVLLELVTGRKNTDYDLPSGMEMLLGWVWSSQKRGNVLQTIDPAIIETCDEEQALRCLHVGLLCTQADSSLRPPMSTVTLMLSTNSVTLADPTKPAYVTSLTQNINFSTSYPSGLSHGSAPTSSSVSPYYIPQAYLSNSEVPLLWLVPS